MTALPHHHEAHFSQSNPYTGMSPDLLVHKMWESLDQLRDTLTQSTKNTRQMVENSRLMMSKWHRVTEIIQDLVQEEAVHEHLQMT